MELNLFFTKRMSAPGSWPLREAGRLGGFCGNKYQFC